MRRVAVIGLDSAPPALVFERWRDQLPTLSSLMDRGVWGALRSCHPPITVPAWSSMLSSRDPGELGLYGFRDRRSYRYGDSALASSRSVRAPRVWDLLSRRGGRSLLVGVPQTYPPAPIDGCVVSCFLTPNEAEVTTHPRELRGQIDALCGRYQFDIEGFRDSDRADLLDRIYAKTIQDFAVSRFLLTTRPWDFFMLVVMGSDRIQHAFWPPHDDPGAPEWEILRGYYRHLDAEIGRLLDLLGDDTVVLVASDHGAKRMDGGIRLNEWLIANGYLRLKERPGAARPLRAEMIDWSRTAAWSDGGYCGRIYLNVAGREEYGTVAASRVEAMQAELAAGIASLAGPDGEPLASQAHRPEALYAEVNGVAPDLMVYLGDLSWRALASVGGSNEIYATENDTGRDGANHDWDGIFILHDPAQRGGGQLAGLQLMDVAPTILAYADENIATDEMRGRAVAAAKH